MKLKTFVEEFVDRVVTTRRLKGKEEQYEVFANPTRKELSDIIEDKLYEDPTVRFIIDTNNKKIYVFDSELLHQTAANALDIPYDYKPKMDGYLFGIGNVTGGKIKISNYHETLIGREARKNEWLKKYIVWN